MNDHLKQFANHAAYQAAESNLDKPNVSLCVSEGEVHYNPWVETRLVAIFNITNTSSATSIMNSGATSQFSEIEIDGVVQPSVINEYTFDTTGEHIIKYTLVNNTIIGNSAFYNCKSLTSITIPNNVTNIEDLAFAGCNKLSSVTIPNSVISIGNSVFNGCNSLTSATIGNSVTSIGNYAFQNTRITSIIIPNSVTSIGSYAFYACTGLTSITIGNSVTSIGGAAFSSCSGLVSIICNAITAPTIKSTTFQTVKTGGTLTVPVGSTGYNVWMGTGSYYLGKYNWTKIEQ